MADYKKSLYSISLNQQGFLLSGIPKQPARQMSKAIAVGVEPTQFDEMWRDGSSFFPWVQTDWSGGFQFEKWTDNAGFKSGTALEYISKYGQLTLLNNLSSTLKDFGAGFTFGASLEYDRDNVGLLIGITKGSGASQLWRMSNADSFAQITTGWANVNAVHDMDELQGKVYIGLTVSAGSALKSYTLAANVADITLTGALASSTIIRMVKRIESRLYVGGYTGTAASGDALMYSDDEGTTWTAIISKTGKNRTISQGVDNLGTLYFLISDGNRTELWWCNDTTVTQIYRWEDLTSPKISKWLGKVYVIGKENGKIRKFEWNGATLKTVFEERIDGLDLDTSPTIIYQNNQYSYGLVYDGLIHFPSYNFKYTANKIYPFAVFGNGTTEVPYFYGLSGTNLIITKLSTTAFQTTGNVISGVFNSSKPAVDKLWHSIILSFKALVASQTIVAEYSADDETTWTAIGTITPITGEKERTIYLPSNTISKRIQIRLTLTGGGTNTPTLYDVNVRHLILPDDKFRWRLTLNCFDNLVLLDGKTKEAKRADELRSILRIAEVTKNIVEFQDVDFAETLLNGALNATVTTITVDSTNNFPEQGRLRIEQEEILYTGKTAFTFTGCTRGARGTLKASHLDNTETSNSYKVILTSVAEATPTAPQAKANEAVVSVLLLEV